MNTSNNLFIKTLILACFAVSSTSVSASNIDSTKSKNDTLSLNQIMTIVINNHPIIKKAEESINKADAKIGLAKSGYYPNVDATVNVSNIGPVPSFNIPNMGSFKLYPNYNFNAGVNVRQNVYDFGKTSSNIHLSNKNKELTKNILKTTKQKLAMKVIKNYYTILFLQEATKIKDEQLQILKKHLEYVKKRQATGSGTEYDILSTKVKISTVENQKLDITTQHDVQLAFLNSLLGLPAKTKHAVKDTLLLDRTNLVNDSTISYALKNRNEMTIAQEKNKLAQLNLNVIKYQNRPSLNAILEGGWKNGYAPDVDKIKANYIIGLGLRVPIFDGTRTKYRVMEAQSSINKSSMELELTKRKISSEVVETEARLKSAYKKLNQSKLQLRLAQEAFKLAKTNYSTGAITNLDLLDATRNVSESKLMLLKSQINCTISIYFHKASLGKTIY